MIANPFYLGVQHYILAASLSYSICSGLPNGLAASTSSPIREIYSFSNATNVKGLENLAVRANGQIIFSLTSAAELYTLDPFAVSPTPTLLHKFSGRNATVGIAETALDVFAVAVGNYSTTDEGITGSFGVFSVDMNLDPPRVRLLTDIPEAKALNGMSTVTGDYDESVFIADSDLGAIWKLNTSSGQYTQELQNKLFLPPGTGLPLGIDGVRVFGQSLYFTNAGKATFGCVPLNPGGNTTANGLTVLKQYSTAGYGSGPDDLRFDSYGNAFLAYHPNSIIKVDPLTGQQWNVTAKSPIPVYQPTAVAFGRAEGACSLYIVTAGEGLGKQNSQIIEIDVCEEGPWSE